MSAPDDFERGRLHEKVQEHDRRLRAINGSIDRAEVAITDLRTEVAKLATRVALASAVAALIGSGVTAAVVAYVT